MKLNKKEGQNGIIRDLNTSNHEINRSFCCSFSSSHDHHSVPLEFKNHNRFNITKTHSFLHEKNRNIKAKERHDRKDTEK
ncbi:hypothetical protein Peur_059732 [Populus x canadensis]